MLEFKFDWSKNIEIGIEEIDNQHKELFRIMRDIEQVILTGGYNLSEYELLEKLCALREYVTYHFFTEEKMMEEMNSKHLEEHRRQHEEFKNKINSISCVQLVQNPTQGFKNVKEMVQELFFEHILVEDKKIIEEQ